MAPEWFKPRSYRHFDSAVAEAFAGKTCNPLFVQNHAWLPLINYAKKIKRYKPHDGRTVYKVRPIMYASHKDACILSKYAFNLDIALDAYYERNGLCDHVIAYRKLGKSNYDFSAEAFKFCLTNAPCMVLCFDITGFFDHLNHQILKERLKRVLGVSELSEDWYKVFRNITRFKKILRTDIEAHKTFGPRLKLQTREPIARIADIKAAGIRIIENLENFGIPQGTPISSSFSNLYMIDVDKTMSLTCLKHKALYKRYSDDILIICGIDDADKIEDALQTIISGHKLELKEEKTDKVLFDIKNPKAFQYLGFNISPDGATIRPGSMARQWRRAKRSIARIRRIGEAAIAAGKAEKIYTKKLRKILSPIGVRNFSNYARRSATAFKSNKIVRQVRRLEVMADNAIREIKGK